MQRIRFDKARKEIVLKDVIVKGKAKRIKGKFLGDISANFERDESKYYNHSGLTYQFSNPKGDGDDDVDVRIKSKVTIDEELAARFLKGTSQETLNNIAEIKEEYYL